MRRLRFWKYVWLAQGHPGYKASRLWSWDSNLSDFRIHAFPIRLYCFIPFCPTSALATQSSGYNCKGSSAEPRSWQGRNPLTEQQEQCHRRTRPGYCHWLEGFRLWGLWPISLARCSLQVLPVSTRGGPGVRQMAVLFATSPRDSVCSVPALWSTSGLAWSSSIGTMWA